MVVVCESCSTRFQVDDSRIPPKGTLVRCSRCKSPFIVKAPSASFEETIQDVVAEITDAGGRTVPEPSEDLFDEVGEDLGGTGTRPGREADDEAWEFDELPAGKATRPVPGASVPTSAPRAAGGSPLEEIGSPEEWDLLADSVDATARQATFQEVPEPSAGPAPARGRAEPPPQRAPLQRAHKPERVAPAAQLGRAVAAAGKTGVRTLAWLALALLLAVGVSSVIPAGTPLLMARSPAPALISLPDGEARGVRVRFVENAFAGTLFVVAGELARASADPALGLRVYWVDARGARLGAGEWARPEPSARELRERAPEALRVAPQAALGGPFVAVFDAVPADATGVQLALEGLPAPESAPAASEPAAAPTASSPPSPRPSSG